MGGFTIDGCGVGDSFYPKQDLGSFYCYGCQSIQEFALMEVKRKIKVLYIPTVSINTKYAVGCKKCKNGYYIDDQQRDDLLFRRSAIEVKADGIYFKQISAPPSHAAPTPTAPERQNAVPAASGGKTCPSCGKQQPGSGKFCVYCGTPLPAQETAPKQKFCVYCGAKLPPGQLFCGECGMKCN